jgi:hypothetical protein
VAEYESEQYRKEVIEFHGFKDNIFSNGTDEEKEVVKTVARLVAEDMTERFSMGLFIPRNAPVNYRGELMTVHVYFPVL